MWRGPLGRVNTVLARRRIGHSGCGLNRRMRFLPLLLTLLLVPACERTAPEVEPPAPTLRRLTTAQYANAVHDLLGADVVIPPQLEPDVNLEGFFALGAAVTSISPRGVEQYEEAAFVIADQVVAPGAFDFDCEPADTADRACAQEILEGLARRAWSRPVTADEGDVLAGLATDAAGVLGDFHEGLTYGIAAILQSPNFLYRDELGEPADDGYRFTAYEIATRLSFLFWNTIPDEELLAAAESGDLLTDEGVAAQAERLLASPRAHEGLRAFFTEMFELHQLDSLSKDPTVFVHMSDEVGPSAREETLLGLEQLVFVEDDDIRNMLTTQRTFLNRKLAAIYNVPAPVRDGFGETVLDASEPRRGLLGQASILALQSHPINNSPTLRGKFIRNVLLCHTIPPPPADVDTSIPEPSGTAPTLRDRVDEHLQNPACAGCHRVTDPLGLALENFDAIGRYRAQDNGHDIDPSGYFNEDESITFSGLSDFAALLHDHEDLPDCFSRQLFRYATGHKRGTGEIDALRTLGDDFAAGGYSVQQLLLDLAWNPAFRRTAPVDDSPAEER
jgi:hypothetical protein